MKLHFKIGTTFSLFVFTQVVIKYRYTSANIVFTNLKTVDVNVDRMGSISAWVYQIPLLKGIHFNVVSKISR